MTKDLSGMNSDSEPRPSGFTSTADPKRQKLADAFAEELDSLNTALQHFGLLGDKAEMNLVALSADRRCANMRPSRRELPVASLDAIHKTIFTELPEVSVVLTLNTKMSQAVARLPRGLRCLAQGGAYFHDKLTTCESADGVLDALRGTKRSACALAVRSTSTFYVLAESPGVAFTVAFYLDKACWRELLVGNKPVTEPSHEVWDHAVDQVYGIREFSPGFNEWPAVLSWLHGTDAPQKTVSSSAEEQALRVELSEAHKELNRLRLDELNWNHVSAKFGSGLLITPGDSLWSSVEPETLLMNSENCTANLLHEAVYDALPTSKAVVHTHTVAIEAVSCLTSGMIEPAGSEFCKRVAYHTWQGISDDDSECPLVIADIRKVSDCTALIMRNHGAITWGCNIREAMDRMLALDAACRETLQAVSEKDNIAVKQLIAETEWQKSRPWVTA
jgi:ribulose-5-phosphate 4-epimerase/fuculose-1-phosphate aldolase